MLSQTEPHPAPAAPSSEVIPSDLDLLEGRSRLPLWALPPVQWLLIALPLIALGWLLDGPLALTRSEDNINQWFADRRQDWLDDLTVIPTRLASTEGIVIVAGLAAVFFLARRRWPSLLLMGWALTAELSIFLFTNLVTGRPRPDVVKLDSVPATSSFPSGHVAATVALYGSLALIVTLRDRRPAAAALWVWAVFATVAVAFARVYRGAHHVSDVIGGAALGVACIIAATILAHRAAEWMRDRGYLVEAQDLS
jgi:undecaprenyl-diphosphatase